jgi:hypothetical protein
MNDDELRDHLRSTLEPVSSPTPELARLRRLARRRRRRLQGTAAGLGLLLIAGAGVGIAEATSSGSGRAVLTTAPRQNTTAMVSCDTAMHDTASIKVAQGQVLTLTDCPDGSYTMLSGGGVLIAEGVLKFRAAKVGTTDLELTFRSCANAPASVRPECVGGTEIYSFAVTVTPAPTSPQSPQPIVTSVGSRAATPVVTAPCKGGHIGMFSGSELILADCPVGVSSHVDDPTVLTAGTSPNSFTATKAGTTNVELFVKPQCASGMLCPQYVRALGTLVVTVTAH